MLGKVQQQVYVVVKGGASGDLLTSVIQNDRAQQTTPSHREEPNVLKSKHSWMFVSVAGTGGRALQVLLTGLIKTVSDWFLCGKVGGAVALGARACQPSV